MIFSKCRQIVRVIPGQTTGGDDDRYVCSDGSVWEKVYDSGLTTTVAGQTAYLHNGSVCDHR